MLLRHKFGLLALIYVSSILLTLVVAIRCIVVYFDSAFREAHTLLIMQDEVEHLRSIVRAQFALLRAPDPGDRLRPILMDLDAEFVEVAARLEDPLGAGPHEALWQQVRAAYAPVADLLRGPRLEEDRRDSTSASDLLGPTVTVALDASLASLRSALSDSGQARVIHAAGTQERVVGILVVNAGVATLMCALGLVLVRRWIMGPIGVLRAATRRVAEGDYASRINLRAQDELGRLGGEVNHMCAMITAMQSRLAEQERLAGAGEMFSRLAHNIRNPLAGLRGLAEETLARHGDDEGTRECQQRIIDTVDRFEKWLRDLQQSVSPLTIQPESIELAPWIENIVAVARPMAQRRGVEVRTQPSPVLNRVTADARHLEQALVALVTNAVQATPSGGCVTVRAEGCDGAAGWWELCVEDTGEGIEPELRKKVFQPYFTTKADGQGLGLAMVERIAKLHGGRAEWHSRKGSGSRFTLKLPLLPSAEPGAT